MWHMGDGWGWWMVFGSVWMVLFWGLIIWAVYTVISRMGGQEMPASTQPAEPSATEILERRYAHGELSHEEFEEMRRRLTGTESHGPVGAAAARNGGSGQRSGS